jgi:uncharacterized protein with PQ loop repeat
MTSHALGEITVSISTVIYFFWFVPQLWLNYQRKSTEGLSLWMHGLLLLGYSADLLYGFGRHMQWQYRLVTVVGLIFLFMQHIQFALYDNKTKAEKINYVLLTCVVVAVFTYAVFNFTWLHHGKQYYDIAGFISDVCWMTYLFPQIIKNFYQHSTEGLSVGFITIAVVLSFLDLTSTVTLHWDWPSVLSECITLFKKSILVFQFFYYRHQGTRRQKAPKSGRLSMK